MEKRLYRSRTQRMLAGVCGGIAEYFNIDPTLNRPHADPSWLGDFRLHGRHGCAGLHHRGHCDPAEPRRVTAVRFFKSGGMFV